MKYLKKILIVFIMTFITFNILNILGNNIVYADDDLSDSVMEYEDDVEKEAEKYGMEEYTDLILGIIEEESGGELADVMQSSESMGEAPNSIDDEKASIKQGVKYLNELFESAKDKDVDYESVIQAYNYGGGYIDFVADNGGEHSFELAEEFAKDKAGGSKASYSNPVAEERDYDYRYDYGNMFYYDLVSRHVDGDIGDKDDKDDKKDLEDTEAGEKEPDEETINNDLEYIERNIADDVGLGKKEDKKLIGGDILIMASHSNDKVVKVVMYSIAFLTALLILHSSLSVLGFLILSGFGGTSKTINGFEKISGSSLAGGNKARNKLLVRWLIVMLVIAFVLTGSYVPLMNWMYSFVKLVTEELVRL